LCGICGIYHTDPSRPVDPDVLRTMCTTLRHRGPDDEGIHVDGPVGLGMRRLSIIDLAGGHQPIHNEDRALWIVYNGEMYNYPALTERLAGLGHDFYTRSDTETVVHAYEEFGTGCLEHLNGMFAFALWDGRERRLFLARDRTGIKPLYYAPTAWGLLFGSELKAILAHPDVPRRVDPVALDQYLTFEYVPTPRTIFEGICKLPPGHFLTVGPEGALRVEPYWDMPLEQSESAPPRRLADIEAELRDTLREVVEMEMISDVPIGVLLSGGIDSSAIAAMMTQVAPGNVRSFSITFDDPSFDESDYARLVADHLGTQHHERRLTPGEMLDLIPRIVDFMDEPLADSSLVPTTLLARFAREHVKVALGGDGGDELFAGYSTLQAHRLVRIYKRAVPEPLRRGLAPAIASALPTSFANISLDFKIKRFVDGDVFPLPVRHHRWLGSFTTEEKHALLLPELRRSEEETYEVATDHVAHCQARHFLNRALYLDMKMYMEGDILPKADRASMSASLELRVPMLNHRLLAFCAALSHRYKLHGLQTKYILRRALRGLVPYRILRRGKKGFNMPVARWLTGELREFAYDMLAPEKLRREGFFEPEPVQRLLDDHMAHRRDARKHLWTLLTFELWLDRWAA
jgi:asparagine synthase (glutamine-hydrolysing)